MSWHHVGHGEVETVTDFASRLFYYWCRYCIEHFVFLTSVRCLWFQQNIFLHCTGLEVLPDCTQHRLMRTASGQEDIQVCKNETSNGLVLGACKIRTVGMLGEECTVVLRDEQLPKQPSEQQSKQCEPSFTLMTKNQTVFLHLTSLTPLDSGNYTCECTHAAGMQCILLNLTVEGKQFFCFLNLFIFSGTDWCLLVGS